MVKILLFFFLMMGWFELVVFIRKQETTAHVHNKRS